MDSEKQHITLHIGPHRVGLYVPREDEVNYRQAAEMLNERSQYYLQHVPEATSEQIWMYVALEVATNWQRDLQGKRMEPVEKKMKEMNEWIENALQDPNAAQAETDRQEEK